MHATARAATLAAAILSSVVTLSACGGAEARRESHMSRGEKYLADGNLEKAQVEFRNALQITPNDVAARLANARVAEKLGNVRGAVGLYQSVIDLDAENVDARASLGRVFVFAGSPERALEMIEPALAKQPDDAELLTVRGAARSQLNDRNGALADAERAVKLDARNENASALLASLYRQNGDTGKAIELVEKTLQSAPDSVDLRQVLANLYVTVDKPERAEAQLRKVIELKPEELSHRYQLAVFYARLKRLDDAERVLKAAMAAKPDEDEPKLAYVEFLTTHRSPAQGAQALTDFIQQDPEDYDLQLGLGALQQKSGETNKALATYRSIIAKADDRPQGLAARNRIAGLLVTERKLDEALKLVAEVLQKNPRDNDALVLRGNIALERKDANTAIADLRAVLRDQPGAVPVMRTLARAHLANGEPALAEETLRNALEAAPQDIVVRNELAQLLMQTNRPEPAVALLEEAVKSAPADLPVRESLVRAYIARKDFDSARRAAEDLKILAPERAVGYYLAGVIAQQQNRFEDAGKDLAYALELQPSAVDALTALTRQDLSSGRNAQAVARVQAVVSADSNNAPARNLLGEIYIAQKEYAKAVTELDGAVRVAPKWWLPYRNLALARIASGDMAAGMKTYESGIAATGFEPALVTDLAALYERQNRFEDAIRQYEALHQRSPKLEVAANNLAMLLVTYKQDQASLDRARNLTASFAESANAALLDTHGWVRFKRGEVTEALPALERAVERSPESKVIRYHLAMAQLKAGQKDKARSNLEQALAGNTPFSGMDEARSALAELTGRAG